MRVLDFLTGNNTIVRTEVKTADSGIALQNLILDNAGKLQDFYKLLRCQLKCILDVAFW